MGSADDPRSQPVPGRTGKEGGSFASFALLLASAVLVLAVLIVNVQSRTTELALRICLTAATFVFALLLANFIRTRRRTEKQAEIVFADNVQDFRQMAENIQEIFWIIDSRTKKATFVNPAYKTITGYPCQSLIDEPSSYERVIHPEDRSRVLGRLAEAMQTGHFDEKFRIVRADGEIRWIWAHGFPRIDIDGNVTRLAGTALDITGQKIAEDQVAANLAKAKSAWAEAEALRKATLSLTGDLHMDSVLDTLLCSLAELVPYTCARVLVPEGGPHWLALGERSGSETPKTSPRVPLTLIADECPLFQRIWSERRRILISDTSDVEGWETFTGHDHLRSWLCVPLAASEELLGFLSVAHIEAGHFSEEDLRRTELLAIPAAAAIQNARLYSTAEMYGSELEKRLADLERTERALGHSEEVRRASEEKFQKIFHCSPISFSITTLEGGRFLEVNAAFEARYGYSRKEVLGHTVEELRIWENAVERRLLLRQLMCGGVVRNAVTRFRTKSGELKLTAFSADQIVFEGEKCILAVSEDVSIYDPKKMQ